MSDTLSAFKDIFAPGKHNVLVCIVLFFIAIALLLCGIVSPCLAGAIIFFGIILCCCSACF